MNILNCCRVCLEEAAFTAFSLCEYIGNATIKSLIQDICKNVDLDAKPELICGDCLNELKTACSFKQKCETSDQFLRSINVQTRFHIFDNDDNDFIDTSLFDEDYFMNENELKPDFEELLEPSTSKEPPTEPLERKQSGKRAMVKCATCSEHFSGPSRLLAHARDAHDDRRPFKCTLCTRCYTNPKALKVHTRSHDAEKKFKCSECSAGFHVKASLLAHAAVHSGQRFQCELCEKSFTSLSYMRQHRASHAGESVICTFNACHRKFPSQLALRAHLKVHADRSFVCSVCPSAFKTRQSLKVHALKHSGTDSKLFQCHICGFATKYRQHFHDHVRAHGAQRDLECFHCAKRFTKKTLLALHMQTHLSARTFVCGIEACGRAFKTYNSYYAHKRTHEARNAPRYSCASCDKVFASHSVLLAHRVIHTGEKTHICHHAGCTKAYAHKQNLNVHLLTAHVEQDVTFKCELCDKVLSNSNQLRVHLSKIHRAAKSVACTDCEMSFASIQLLRIHAKSHRPRAFNCEFCNYSANYEVDLQRHLVKAHEASGDG